jgi:hypothetical protein
VEPKFAEILKAMASAEIQIKSPSVPFFKGGMFRSGLNPLFDKEGKGRFVWQCNDNYVANFSYRTLAVVPIIRCEAFHIKRP